jgi:hypothetical protein
MSTGKNGLGHIDYLESKLKGHKVITGIHRDTFKEFIPKYSLRRVKTKVVVEETKESVKSNYPKVQIDEVFLLGKHIEVLN